MQYIGHYFNRQVYWFDYNNLPDQLPNKDWICLAIASKNPEPDKFDRFIRTSISKNLLEFKGAGSFGEKLHDCFDETKLVMETIEAHKEVDVMTTWHNDEILADTFWQCFFVTCLPDTADFDNIKIICTDLDGLDRREELLGYIKNFESGWLPSNN